MVGEIGYMELFDSGVSRESPEDSPEPKLGGTLVNG